MRKCERAVVTSALCELPNLRGLKLILSPIFARFKRRAIWQVAVVVIDIDNFKKVNDVLGYRNADRVIQAVGAVLWEHVRSTDVVAHIHGDEFVVVFTDLDEHAVRNIMERAQKAFKAERYSCTYGEDGVPKIAISFSFGVAHSTQSSVNFEELFDDAEFALKSMKKRNI